MASSLVPLHRTEPLGGCDPELVQVALGNGTSCRLVGDPASTIVFGVYAGQARWVTAEREYVVRQGSCLVLPAGPPRTLIVDARSRVRTALVAFHFRGGRDDTADVGPFRATSSAHRAGGTDPEVDAMAGLWPAGGMVGLALARVMEAHADGPGAPDVVGALAALESALRRVARLHLRRAERIDAVRRSTRLERLRRVFAGRDHMESHLGDSLRLADVARAAAMSSFHFHRAFVQVFGRTPHSYLLRRRLSMAMTLLASSHLPIAEVAYRTGFGSAAAFSSAFRRRLRTSPRAFRRWARTPRSEGRRRRWTARW